MSAELNFACWDCGKDVLAAGEFVALHDDVWALTGFPRTPVGSNRWKDGLLCIACIERRIGRPLTGHDLRSDDAAGVPTSPYLIRLWLKRSGQGQRRRRLGRTLADDYALYGLDEHGERPEGG